MKIHIFKYASDIDHAVPHRKGNNIKLSEIRHSVIKESSCLMLYRPIIHKSSAEIRMVKDHEVSVLQEWLLF